MKDTREAFVRTDLKEVFQMLNLLTENNQRPSDMKNKQTGTLLFQERRQKEHVV